MAPDDGLEARIEHLRRSMDKGFEQVRDDLGEVKADVKLLQREAVLYRVKALETWRDGLATRLWTFLIGCAVASASAWIAVVARSAA